MAMVYRPELDPCLTAYHRRDGRPAKSHHAIGRLPRHHASAPAARIYGSSLAIAAQSVAALPRGSRRFYIRVSLEVRLEELDHELEDLARLDPSILITIGDFYERINHGSPDPLYPLGRFFAFFHDVTSPTGS